MSVASIAAVLTGSITSITIRRQPSMPPARPAPPPCGQTWCRGKKKWESECLCLECHSFSFRSYCDPDFKTPEDYEKERWQVGPFYS